MFNEIEAKIRSFDIDEIKRRLQALLIGFRIETPVFDAGAFVYRDRQLLDLLEVPQRNRTAGTFRRLSKVMSELGWSAVRVRDLTRGGYKEQVRGYCREARGPHSARYS